jgi:hypothetical protein
MRVRLEEFLVRPDEGGHSLTFYDDLVLICGLVYEFLGITLALSPMQDGLTALKKVGDEGGLILRFYEWTGKESDIKLQLPVSASSGAESDLLEKLVADLAFQEGTVTVDTKPFEIKTVRIRFASNLPATPAERSSN